MTTSPPVDGVRRRRPVGLALTLMLAPYVLAVLYLLARRTAESPSALAR